MSQGKPCLCFLHFACIHTNVQNIAADIRGIHTIFFLILHENISCGYSLEASWPGTSNEYPQYHTCHKLWTKIYEIRQNYKGVLTKFCEIFLNITLELPKYRIVFFFSCKKLVKTTTMYDLYVFLHKTFCKMV